MIWDWFQDIELVPAATEDSDWKTSRDYSKSTPGTAIDEKAQMTNKTLSEQIEALAEVIVSSRRIVVFTGAGISIESDAPDFRQGFRDRQWLRLQRVGALRQGENRRGFPLNLGAMAKGSRAGPRSCPALLGCDLATY
jgi:hypothetical protein